MPTFSFTFAAALWALPLAAVPIVLHLLNRRKSPVILFSTLRFVKMSVQRTAARRKLQKWLLLACRALLIALLVWAVAQPVRKLGGNWLGSRAGGAGVAAIVVDTSYSMQLQDGTTPLLSKADAAVQDLLRGPLAGTKVAILTSRDTGPEQLRDASAILAEWSPLRPQAATVPLVDRAASAAALLDRQPPGPRWMVVISDFQSAEFPRAVPQAKDARTVLLDMHPTDVNAARSAGVTRITITPQPPIAGLPAEAAVEITGPPGDVRAVRLRTTTTDGKPLAELPPAMAALDATGRGTVRFPFAVPAEHFVAVTAELTADDAMPWDNARTQLVEVPPRQKVAFLQQQGGAPGERFVHLALDPNEGTLAQWPLDVHTVPPSAPVPAATDDVAVAVLARWPGPHTAAALRDFATAGHTVVLFLTPGLEDAWPALPAAVRSDLSTLLPSAPIRRPGDVPRRAVVADANDPLLAGLTDEKFELGKVIVRRMVPLVAEANATAILTAAPVDPTPDARSQGLLFRKSVGRGRCFTFATAPDPASTNLGTHPTFLPLIVRTGLRPPERSAAQNVELGKPITVDPLLVPPAAKALQVTGPRGDQYQVASPPFAFAAVDPGTYAWHRPTDAPSAAPLAWSNVQLPAAESDLSYRPAATVAPPDPATVVAASVAELTTKIDQLSAPDPQWQWPLVIVMFLLCLEALMGSWPRGWQRPAMLRGSRPAAETSPV